MKPTTIYALSSTRNGEIRYIGQTVRKPDVRLRMHLNVSKDGRTHVACWIRGELAAGFEIVATILEENAVWNEAEIAWIAKHKALGTRLVNHTDGGGGMLGLSVNKGRPQPWTAERNRSKKGIPTGHVIGAEGKERIAETQRARTGWKHSEGALAKIGAAARGKPKSEETKEKLRAKAKARYQVSPEKFSMSSARSALPTKQSQETKDKRAASHKGKTRTPEARARISAGLKASYERKRIQASALLA